MTQAPDTRRRTLLSCATSWRWAAFWLWFGLLVPALAHASLPDPDNGQMTVERALWVDPTGEASLEQALEQVYAPAPRIVARGYRADATWLRVTVPATPADNLWVTIQPLYLDDVQVFSRSWQPDGTRGPWTLRQEGDRHPFAGKELRTLLFSLRLDTSPTEPTVFYVRLRTTSTHAMYVSVRTSTSALDFEGQILLGLGLYLGVVLVLAWMSAVRFVITRDALWAFNVLLQSGTALLAVFYVGVSAKYLLPQAPRGVDQAMSTVLCGHVFLSVLYYRKFAATFQASSWVVWAYTLVLLALPWQLWLIWNDQARPALALNSNLLLLASLLGMGANWFFRIEDVRLRWTVRCTYTAQTVYLVVFVLPLLGVGQMTLLHLYPALLVNLFASVMQHLVLARRDQLSLQATQRLEREMQAAQSELRAQQAQLSVTTSFVGMLLHELKNPLASVRLATLNLLRTAHQWSPDSIKRLGNIQAAVDGMDAVLDRCRQVDRLDSGAWTTAKVATDAAGLLADAMARSAAPARLRVEGPEQLAAHLDVQSFLTMVGNLLDNALGYSPPGSMVDVKLTAHAGGHGRPEHLVVTVRNAVGKAGLPDAKQVFDKYYRSEGAHLRTGSGLGLYLVKNLASLAGGGVDLQVEMQPLADASAGSVASASFVVFSLWLPCR